MKHIRLSETNLQRQILRLYGELVSRREIWAGKLVFACGEGISTSGLPVAVSIAGGTSLMLDPDAAMVKAVFRQGGLDFVVNTLDEALRVLKNEIRKHRPLSVGLVAALQPTLAEMVERGVMPDVQVSTAAADDEPVELGALQQLGMQRLQLATREEIIDQSERLTEWLRSREWTEVVLESGTSSALRELDAELMASVPAQDTVRQAWLQRIAHYQRPVAGGSRVVWLTQAEQAARSN